MHRLVPYQFGLWLAEYVNIRCQLCGCYRKASYTNPADSTPSALSASRLSGLLSTANKSLLCSRCQHSIAWLPAPFYVDIAASVSLPIQAASYYDYPIREAIRAFKHSEDMTRLPLLVHMLRQLTRPKGCHAGNSVIIPMPTTDDRLRKRGFDPVTILSIHLAKHWKIPLWHGVARMDDTVSQQGLTRSERLTNLNDAFVLTETPPVKRLLLFDDVATTGASLQALARAFLPDQPYLTPLEATRTAHGSMNYATDSASQTADVKTNKYHISAYALAHGSQNQ
ncbi:ComF family protein [uncultured Psychrobacter sp.]|uniref:ComF family protein n=1 Tax=uncultured Psychrobacter sp. TaxID=259303 RepID=UPI00260479F3|nr:ComF family protein [uncultured Psychrobacter sp.]